jgi:hypothetical protein
MMREPERRQRILDKLSLFWHAPGHGDMRLYQIFGNLSTQMGWEGTDTYYLEDAALEALLDERLGELRTKGLLPA